MTHVICDAPSFHGCLQALVEYSMHETNSLCRKASVSICSPFLLKPASAPFLKGTTIRSGVFLRGRSRVMPKQVKARTPQDEREARAVRKLARSHHAPADWIWHARMVVESWAGKTPDRPRARRAFQPARH
jgi:hypothetical protein